MSITIANLVAQIGSDMTQFRLGMNEVDARLQSTATRAGMAASAVDRYRAAATRASRDAASAYSQRASIQAQLPAMRAAAVSARAAATAALAEVASVHSRMAAAVASGATTMSATMRKELRAAEVAMRRTQAEVVKTENALGRSTAKVSSLWLKGGDLTSRAGQIGEFARDTTALSAAHQAFDLARAARIAQNSQEYRFRAVNAVAGTAMRAGEGGFAALGTAAIAGADFNLKLTQAAHNTSLTAAAMDEMRAAVKRLGMESGAPMDKLADGFRRIENFGFNAADSTKILTEAMKGAVAKGADVNATADILAGTMKNFKVPVAEAAATMGVLFNVSRMSRVELNELVHAIQPAFAFAANRGASIAETGAAFVLFTRHQLDASRATTQFINVLNKIAAPTKKVRDEIAALDKQFGTQLTKIMSPGGFRAAGIEGWAAEVQKAAKGVGVPPEDLAFKLLPNLRATVGGTTIAKNLKEYIDIVKQLTDANQGAAEVNRRYERTLQEVGQQIAILKNSFVVLAGAVSEALAPTIKGLAEQLGGAAKWFAGLDKATKDSVVSFALWASAALVAFGVVTKLIVGFASLRIAIATMGLTSTVAALGPIAAVVAAVAVVVGAGVLAWNKLTEAQEFNYAEEIKAAEAARVHSAAVVAQHQNAIQLVGTIGKLRGELEKMHGKTKEAAEKSKEMHKALNDLSVIAPELIKGYDAQGNAIGVMTEKMEAFVNATRAAQHETAQLAAKQLLMQRADIGDRGQAAREQLSIYRELQTRRIGLRPGVRAIRNEAGELIPEGGGGSDMYDPVIFEKATAAQMAHYARRIRELKAEEARYIRQQSDLEKAARETVVKQYKSPTDLFVHHKGVPPADPLAGLGDRRKAAAKEKLTEEQKEYNEAIGRLLSLTEAMFRLTHAGHEGSQMWAEQAKQKEKDLRASFKKIDAVNKESLSMARSVDAMAKVKAEVDEYKRATADLTEKLALNADATELQRLKWRMSHGDLNQLTIAEKNRWLAMQKELDLRKQLIASGEEYGKSIAETFAAEAKGIEKRKEIGEKLVQSIRDRAEAEGSQSEAVKLSIQLQDKEYKDIAQRYKDEAHYWAVQVDAYKAASEAAKVFGALMEDVREPVQRLDREIAALSDDLSTRAAIALEDFAKKHKEAFAAMAINPFGLPLMGIVSAGVMGATKESIDKEKTFEVERRRVEMTKEIARGLREVQHANIELGGGLKYTKAEWDSLSAKVQADAKKLAAALTRLELVREFMQGFEGVILRSLNNVRDHGFRNFFRDVVRMFDDMLFQMAAKWLASQAINAIGRLVGVALGGGFGGGQTDLEGLGGGLGAIGGAVGAPVGAESRGFGAPVSSAGDVYHVHATIVTPDVQSFNRSQGQVGAALAQALQTMQRRNS